MMTLRGFIDLIVGGPARSADPPELGPDVYVDADGVVRHFAEDFHGDDGCDSATDAPDSPWT